MDTDVLRQTSIEVGFRRTWNAWTVISGLALVGALVFMVQVRTSGSAPSTISRDEAIAVASEVAGAQTAGSSADALLGTISSKDVGGDSPLVGRSVWIVHFDSLSIPAGGPVRPDGVGVDGGTLHNMFVFVDATTGEWLYSRVEK